MTVFFQGVFVIAGLELRQRVRSTAWSVLLFVFGGIVFIVTVLLTLALGGLGGLGGEAGGGSAGTYSSIIYFVLLLGTLVAPAMSGNAINGDRDAGTLATTQVTLITTWQLVIGKFLAAWVTALAFLAVAVPFMAFSAVVGGLDAATIVISVLVLAFELGLIAAIGVGLSGIIVRPLFSIVVTYLVAAALSIGTLLAFTLASLTTQSEVTSTFSSATSFDEDGRPEECVEGTVSTYGAPRFDYFWGILVANPYVVLADAVPTRFTAEGYPDDLFGAVKVAARSAQVAPDLEVRYSECDGTLPTESAATPEETIEGTVPGWFVGMLIHLLVGAGALTGAWASIRTPAKRLAKGSRIA